MIDKMQIQIWAELDDLGTSQGPCPYCGGLGCLGVDKPFGHPAFGRAFVCICQRSIFLQRYLNRMLVQAGSSIPEVAKKMSFDDFVNLPHARTALFAARQMALGELITNGSGIVRPGIF